MTLEACFKQERPPVISYLMVGDRGYDASLAYAKFLVESGVEILELGMPFSDPVADGEIILEAGKRSLACGTRTEDVFKLAKAIRVFSDIPLIVMGYLNPIYQYGYEKFAEALAQAGIVGLIVPDLPFEEREELTVFLEPKGIHFITMLALNTGEERLKTLASKSSGFIYLVAVKGITGTQRPDIDAVGALATKVKALTKTPVVAGFGIQSREDINRFNAYVDGVVIASQFIKLRESGDLSGIEHILHETLS